jgi:hypothetical protein
VFQKSASWSVCFEWRSGRAFSEMSVYARERLTVPRWEDDHRLISTTDGQCRWRKSGWPSWGMKWLHRMAPGSSRAIHRAWGRRSRAILSQQARSSRTMSTSISLLVPRGRIVLQRSGYTNAVITANATITTGVISMHCFVCAQRSVERPAVALCSHCLVGLCMRHLEAAQQPGPGGTHLGCRHTLPSPEPVRVGIRQGRRP